MPDSEYVLNHHARLLLTVTTPVRHSELQSRSMILNQERGFLQGVHRLLSSGLVDSLARLLENPDPSALPAEHVQWLLEMGVLLPAEQMARTPVFEPELEAWGETAGLAAGLPDEPLVLNPSLCEQVEAAPPAHLAAQLPGWEQMSGRRPLLWLRTPLSQIWLPLWLPPQVREQMAKGGELDAGLQASLYQAGVLIPASQADWGGPGRTAHIAGLRRQLQQQEYLSLRQVLPQAHLRALSAYVRTLASEGFFQKGDPMVPERNGIHNEPLMRFLHLQITPFLQEILGEPIRASYAFLADYQPGAVLRKHTDRSQCDWNLSLVLDMQPQGSPPWPFYLENAAGTAKIELGVGDLVFYSGTRNPHWREQLPAGQVATVVFFHFVSPGYSGTLL
ncbi:MAG: hypothetical protein ACAI44_18810 [Candidatus Sericytochromatia bacterium]